ncbi:hypothetical protein TNCV_626521 [Trichonephila clavipes]|nr:hypothetical protein TNCV_626521 [Trichonephila clavipes]
MSRQPGADVLSPYVGYRFISSRTFAARCIENVHVSQSSSLTHSCSSYIQTFNLKKFCVTCAIIVKVVICHTLNLKHGTGEEGNILQPTAPMVSAATAHKTFGPPDLTSSYTVCARRVFGGIGHLTQAFRSGVR